MKLTNEEVLIFMDKIGHNRPCPFCGSIKAKASTAEVEALCLPTVENGSIVYQKENPSYMPIVHIVCPDCGYVMAFNLAILELIPKGVVGSI